ncbi:hypothetical protein Taro_040944 [Colocasia esculenta]|uniref:Uncharacterized protein n=1 Tax=Colocasia esculenta TaxID=4460 RepID=A0A843WD36_COLES|nr:hypothetical protein [Colocasia esculenta]
MQAHTQAALQEQLEAQERADVWWASLLRTRFEDDAVDVASDEQEGEMEQYLEEKKASQKRPAATFQWQDKKKAVYQTQQRSVAVRNAQTSAGSPARSASPSSGSGSSASYRKTRKASSPSSIV